MKTKNLITPKLIKKITGFPKVVFRKMPEPKNGLFIIEKGISDSMHGNIVFKYK